MMTSWASYGTVLTIAGTSTKYKLSMENHAKMLAQQSAQATVWQESAARDQVAADELQAKAAVDEQEGAALETLIADTAKLEIGMAMNHEFC